MSVTLMDISVRDNIDLTPHSHYVILAYRPNTTFPFIGIKTVVLILLHCRIPADNRVAVAFFPFHEAKYCLNNHLWSICLLS